ncbi:telomerase Cajal body protein 1 isoform X2 [Thrips palmi]|uniref:WD repeat-containing protein 79 n=1 Tax=Thrips palmi TaxID=161013 RepID=A0A6P8YHS8_THRPL|nr:telomerase Cajal body protein 1 isoform X2 [Thrips palmi]
MVENDDIMNDPEKLESVSENMVTTVESDHSTPENQTFETQSNVEVNYMFHEGSNPCLTHFETSQFKTSDCYTKGCKWAPDGLCFLTNSNDNILRVWDLPENLNSVSEWQSNSSVSPIKPSLCMREGGLIYDFCWYPLMNSWNPVTCCLASASKDSPVHLWDAFTGQLRATYRAYNQVDEVEAARSIAFDPCGERLYCGFKNCVRVFDVGIPGRSYSNRNLKSASGETQNGIVSSIAVCPAVPSLFAVGTYTRSVGLYTENTGKALCILQGHEGGITHMKFSDDGMRLYSGGRKDSEIVCWDLREPGKVLFSVPRKVPTHQRIYFDLTPNGKYLLSGCFDGKVFIWDTSEAIDEEGNLKSTLKVFQAHSDCANGLSIHHQKPLIVTCSGQRHYQKNIENDSEDEVDKQPGENVASARFIENSVKLWWVGGERTSDESEKIDEETNC